MLKLALFAINDGCEAREKMLPEVLSEELKVDEIAIMQFTSSNFDEMVVQAKKEADYVVIAIDAVEGVNPTFSFFARKFFENHIRPIILVTNFDSTNANIATAETALGNIWSMQDDSLSYAELEFLTAYFSYDTCMSYDNKYKDNPGNGLSRCVFYANTLNG